MTCYTHSGRAAVGVCAACGKAICHECVGRDTPRLVCAACVARAGTPAWGWSGGSYGMLYEYRSPIAIGGWPLVHVCFGNDPATFRPRVARGIVAIGNAAVGALAIGGAAFGLVTLGGLSVGLVAALGGAALGAGVSIGGLAVGSIAIGGAAVGFRYAIGGAAFGPAVIDGRRCDQAALDFARQWLANLPTACR
jgi:hypothetical protein